MIRGWLRFEMTCCQRLISAAVHVCVVHELLLKRLAVDAFTWCVEMSGILVACSPHESFNTH